VHSANSDLLVLNIHAEKLPPDFLQIQRWSSFSQKTRAQIVQKMLPHSPIEHQTTKTKSLRIRPTMATLILAQHNKQPTNNTAALVEVLR
jgi:ribosomal protein L17